MTDVPGTLSARGAIDGAAVLVDGEAYYAALFEACVRARRYVLLSGWQFDSNVALLRGEAADAAERRGYPVRLLAFLNELCSRRPELEVHVLAWDFSVVYALEREWMQRLAFEWRSHDRVRFTFDACAGALGSHHQKFAVVDGALAFCGSMDLCEHRWDDSVHAPDNALRTERALVGERPYGPYHEVTSVFVGPAVGHLVAFFVERWACATGERLSLGAPLSPGPALADVTALARARDVVELPATWIGLATTAQASEPRTATDDASCPARPSIEASRTVRTLLEQAILSAERLVYVETQYLTARAVVRALARRMRDTTKPPLEVVVLLPSEPEAAKEEIALGVTQARLLAWLADVAGATRSRLGVYSSVMGEAEAEVATYVHSKLVVVDDSLLTLGSANLNNRSMGVDTELNVVFEAAGQDRLARGIARLRLRLLAEHVGVADPARLAALRGTPGLVERLDALARAPGTRLRRWAGRDPAEDSALVDVVSASVSHYLDPEEPPDEEALGDGTALRDAFERGLSRLRERLAP